MMTLIALLRSCSVAVRPPTAWVGSSGNTSSASAAAVAGSRNTGHRGASAVHPKAPAPAAVPRHGQLVGRLPVRRAHARGGGGDCAGGEYVLRVAAHRHVGVSDGCRRMWSSSNLRLLLCLVVCEGGRGLRGSTAGRSLGQEVPGQLLLVLVVLVGRIVPVVLLSVARDVRTGGAGWRGGLRSGVRGADSC